MYITLSELTDILSLICEVITAFVLVVTLLMKLFRKK